VGYDTLLLPLGAGCPTGAAALACAAANDDSDATPAAGEKMASL
jgi:hypothetical protein